MGSDDMSRSCGGGFGFKLPGCGLIFLFKDVPRVSIVVPFFGWPKSRL